MQCDRWYGKSHAWGKWEGAGDHQLERKSDKGIVGRLLYQKRVCQRCGFVEINKQELTIN